MHHIQGKRTLTIGMLLGLATVILYANSAKGAERLPLTLCAPDRNSFTLNIDNSYFPLVVGQQWVLGGEESGQIIGLQITVLNKTETFFKNTPSQVITRVLKEVEWEDTNGNGLIDRGENLREISLNYFAQTLEGTVCYFGEVVDIYENGRVVSHEGSWRADAKGNAPGIFMPAAQMLAVGTTFQQEVAPGIAQDEATIVGSGTVKVPAGTFPQTIKVREFNPLDGGRGYKVYARDVGLIIDDTLELVSY